MQKYFDRRGHNSGYTNGSPFCILGGGLSNRRDLLDGRINLDQVLKSYKNSKNQKLHISTEFL